MKSDFMIFFLMLSVSVSLACDPNEDNCYEVFSKKNNKKWRCQCTEVDDFSSSSEISQPDPDYEKTKDESCEPNNLPVPDFTKPNRRISVTKCYEYIWMMKKEKEEDDRKRRCNVKRVTIKRMKRQLKNDEKEEEELDFLVSLQNLTETNKSDLLLKDPQNENENVEQSLSQTQQLLEGYDYLPTEFPDVEGDKDVKTSPESSLGVYENTTTLVNQRPLLKPIVQILGGHSAFAAEFPHMGAIGWQSVDEEEKWKFKCGCTLISPKFVITAAHCSRTSSRDTSVVDVVPKIIRFGVEDILYISYRRPPVDKNIEKIIVHPQYAPPKKYFDIALMSLAEEVEFTKFVHPACLWSGDINKFKEATVTGWGFTTIRAREGSPTLQAAALSLIDDNTCDRLLKPKCNRLYCGLQSHQFCAGELAGGVDACQGDSGGPIQSKIQLPIDAGRNMYYIIGLTSFGMGCGQRDIPGVYTKISYFIDWIENIVFK